VDLHPARKRKADMCGYNSRVFLSQSELEEALIMSKFSVAFPPTVAKFCGTFLWLVNCILRLMTQCKNNKDVPHSGISGRPHATQSKAKCQGKENNGCHRAAHHTTVMALTRPDGIV